MRFRILNWNIQSLGVTKIAVPGMAHLLAQVIVDTQPDIVIITELRGTADATAEATLAALQAAVTAIADPAAGRSYTYELMSHETGGERYGFLIKDLNAVRPAAILASPATTVPGARPGDKTAPIENLNHYTFNTWPDTFANVANAYGLPLTPAAARPKIPLTSLYAGPVYVANRRKRRKFSGQSTARGGFRQGRGFRLPCLAMFSIQTPGLNQYLLPIIVFHSAATTSSRNRNTLALGQIRQLSQTHIAQKYSMGNHMDQYEFICLDGASTPIRDLMITGDFNVDFTLNDPAALGVARANNYGFSAITPTLGQAPTGSANPAYAPVPPRPPANIPAPATFPVTTDLDPLPANQIAPLNLRTGLTISRTMLTKYEPAKALNINARANTQALADACFDNFFFNGLNLGANYQSLNGVEAQQIYDIPALVSPGVAVAANSYGVGGIWTSYMPTVPGNPSRYYAGDASGLYPTAMLPPTGLALTDRLIGARFLSDHLPSVIEFDLP